MIRTYVYKKTRQGQLKIHVHLPKGRKKGQARPGIVFFFGGGWNAGSAKQFQLQAEYLAGRGMVAARADYRVRSRHGVMPDKCVEDAKSAIRWFRAHAEKLGVDPDRIVAAGGSSGGHMAACAATTRGLEAKGEDLEVSSRPNALVLFNPVLNLVGHQRILERLGGDRKLARQISPAANVKKTTAPAWITFGTNDWLLQTCREFMARGRKVGHRCQLYLARGQFHAFFNHSPWLERTLRRADEFLLSLGYLQGKPTVKPNQYRNVKPPLSAQAKRQRRRRLEELRRAGIPPPAGKASRAAAGR